LRTRVSPIGERRLLKRTPSGILTPLLVGMLTLAFNVHVGSKSRICDVNYGLTGYQMKTENLTLSQVMQSIKDDVDWDKAVYAGVLFNERTKADLETLIDNYVTDEDWLNVLRWSVICKKLGIERESAIKAALDGLPMVGPLPWTTYYGGTNYFDVEQKFALLGYYYAEKYSYRLDKWNKTSAYSFFKGAINDAGHPVLFIDANGDTWTISYGPRYYDESANTVQCFLVFYELGITDALDNALHWWNWINNNLWYQDTHYKYALNWADYECEAGFFTKIVTNLKYYKTDLGNWSRILADLQNRFVIDGWNSKQWCSSNGTTYVVVHHYPSNSQRRLQNTIGAWTTLLSVYGELDNACQNATRDLLKGYNGLDPAWKLLMGSTANLYDSSANKFRWRSDSSLSDEATAYALTLMFLMGIIPQTAVLAFPIEEYDYEYIYDIDPELYGIDLDNNSIRVSVVKGGVLEFIYGASSAFCDFPSSGVYELTFSNDWNNILNVSRLQDLPCNRKFSWGSIQPRHDIAIVNMTLSSYALEVNESVIIQAPVFNNGSFIETFNLSLCYTRLKDPIIGVQTITLVPYESTILNFTWIPNITGKYEIKAYTNPIPNDTNPENNVKIIFIYVITLKGPYYTWYEIEYWIVNYGKRSLRLISNY